MSEPIGLSPWWERRREGEQTSEYLARVLDDLGAYELARQARLCHFDAHRQPPEFKDQPLHHLVTALQSWSGSRSTHVRQRTQAIIRTIQASAEFDATAEETAQSRTDAPWWIEDAAVRAAIHRAAAAGATEIVIGYKPANVPATDPRSTLPRQRYFGRCITTGLKMEGIATATYRGQELPAEIQVVCIFGCEVGQHTLLPVSEDQLDELISEGRDDGPEGK